MRLKKRADNKSNLASCSAVLALVLGSITAFNATADTTLMFAGDNRDNGMMEVSEGRVRMSSPGHQGYMIYETAANRFISVNAEDRSYIVFDEAQVEKISNMQKQLMQQMESQLASMPPAQREQMRKMMSSMMPKMPGGDPKPRRYQRTGSQTVGSYTCENLEIYVGDRKASEQCVVGRGELDIPDEDFQAIRSMQQFMLQVANSFAPMSEQIMDYGEPGQDEIPVRYTHYSKATGKTSGELNEILHQDISPDRFEIPGGYKEQKIPEMDQF